ncbi:MAG: carboxymuconolactone decarboxylase family protein [Candidatus Binatia bacterium]
MPRLPLLSLDEARKRGEEVGIPPNLSRLNAFRVLLHDPTAAGALAKLLMTLLLQGTLDHRTRELVILRIGWRRASEYEFCQHVAVARQFGMNEEDILGVRDPERCASYGEVDRAVLRMTDELLDRSRVSDETWKVLEGAFSEAQLVELLLAAGNWTLFAGFLRSAGVPLDEDVASWPEGRTPPEPS